MMRRWQLTLFGVGMLGMGYLAGASGVLRDRPAVAQEATTSAAIDKIKLAHQALNVAADALKTEDRYDAITQGTNAFLVLAGGGNARQDLESGAGVDPETFAALYAGKAIPELQDQITKDDQGRLTFNGTVIQLYSKTRLQQIYAERLRLSGAK